MYDDNNLDNAMDSYFADLNLTERLMGVLY